MAGRRGIRAARVRVEDFEDGALPMVCAGSGAPAPRRYRMVATSPASGWWWLAILAGPVGIVVAFVLSGTMRTSTEGWVPFADVHEDRVEGRRQVFARVAVAGLAGLVTALALAAAGSASPLLLGVFGVGGGVALAMGGFLWLHPPGDPQAILEGNGRWVVLRPVSAAFADACAEQERRRREARQRQAAAAEDDWAR